MKRYSFHSSTNSSVNMSLSIQKTKSEDIVNPSKLGHNKVKESSIRQKFDLDGVRVSFMKAISSLIVGFEDYMPSSNQFEKENFLTDQDNDFVSKFLNT
jgi:hypothetical protein